MKILSPNLTPLKELENLDILNYKGVLIDIDDTLYSYKYAHKESLKTCYSELKIKSKINKELNSIVNKSFREFSKIYRNARTQVYESLQPNGSCRSRLLAFQIIFEQVSKTAKKNKLFANYCLAREFEEIYWSALIKNITPNPFVYDFIKKSFNQGMIICAVSDMQTAIQVRKLEKLGIQKYIHFLVTSEETGVEKPDSKIFNLALNKINLCSKEVIMIGDSLEKDYFGAEQLGIKSFLIDISND